MLLGIDLGGTTIKAGIVNDNGSIILQDFCATNVQLGFEHIVNDITGLVNNLLAKADMNINNIQSIGIGIPGLTDSKTGNVIYCTNLAWENVPLAERLQARFGIPVNIENDATVAALAESLFGSTKGVPNSVFLTLGTGIGGGIIINGKVYSGSHGAGSEIGHMIVGENFYSCNCGKNGCLETFASATAINKYAAQLIKEGRTNTTLIEMCKGNTDYISARMVFDAAKSGDEVAIEVVTRMVKYLSIGIINIYNMLDPDVITLGGGVAKAGQYLLDLVKKQTEKYVFNANVKYGDITLAQLGNEAGIIGAAFLGR